MTTIRDYKHKDYEATIKLMKILSKTIGIEFDKESWQQKARLRVFNPEYRTLVAEKDDKIVGMCFADIQRDERGLFHGLIRNVVVDPQFKRKGIASKLITSAMVLLRNLKVDSIRVQVNEQINQVVNLFQKFGFKMSRIVMEKDVVKIREYRDSDYEATKELMEIYLKPTNEVLDEDEWKQTVKLRMWNPQFRILISELDSKVTGMAFITIRSDETGLSIGYLQNIIVHPNYRGRGFGKDLLIRAIEILNVMNVDKIRIMAHYEIKDYLKYFEDVGFHKAAYILEWKTRFNQK